MKSTQSASVKHAQSAWTFMLFMHLQHRLPFMGDLENVALGVYHDTGTHDYMKNDNMKNDLYMTNDTLSIPTSKLLRQVSYYDK